MFSVFAPVKRVALGLIASVLLMASLRAQQPTPAEEPISAGLGADEAALTLARQYAEGGPGARAALLDALKRMGWSVRDPQNRLVAAPPAGADTGLALRDYELEELLSNPSAQPTIRLISFARAVAVPLEGADPEELAQGFVDALRTGVNSEQPQQRFWARFVVALGQVGPDGADLTGPGTPAVIPPSQAQMRELQKQVQKNPFAALGMMQTAPAWPKDDPVLAPSPLPAHADAGGESRTERDQKRMSELSEELGKLYGQLGDPDAAKQKAAQEKLQKLQAEMTAITLRMQSAAMQGASRAMARMQNGGEDDEEAENMANRFTAEWREQPLSLLQVGLLARVFAADLKTAAFRQGKAPGYTRIPARRAVPALPLAMLGAAQAAGLPTGGPPTDFGGQFTGAIGDIWATGWGAYTGAVIDAHLPNSSIGAKIGAANTIIAWFKTIMSVVRQNITVEVENVPLVRTKNRSPGEQRRATATVAIDFPKSDVLKALRAAGNLTTVDLQLPDGGPVAGAKVVWRLPEGSYNTKYQTGKGGGAEYRPELAVVQFAKAGGPAAYISYTDDDGKAHITIEGVPQKKILPSTVRPYPRRAVIAVEVTIKVGNLAQDMNDAINTAMGGPVNGTLGFIADMILRTSFFFQKGRVFEVTDWKEPAWEGEFDITVKGSGSKHEKGEKGGPDQDFAWSMNRLMEGRLHTPDTEEENETKKDSGADGKHPLEIDGDSRYFKLTDSSSSRSKNSHNRYEAHGPLQIQPPGRNQLALYSRAEPSGDAMLTLTGGKYILELSPFFGAQCLVTRSEKSGSRSWSRSGAEYLSLLNGVSPDTFSLVGDYDGKSDVIEGSKTFDFHRGNLPYVPGFDVTVTVNYRLWRNRPPPKNK